MQRFDPMQGLRLLILVWFTASVFYLAIGWAALQIIDRADLQTQILEEVINGSNP